MILFLLAIDADVILRRKACEKIFELASETLNKNCLAAYMQFFTLDKFRGPMNSGCHLFLNSYTRLMFNHFKNFTYDPNIFHPESKEIKKLLKILGLERVIHTGDPIGYHDWEQYYLHLFVKWRNRAVKQHYFQSQYKLILENKIKNKSDDLDYLVAYAGFKEGIKSNTVITDAGEYEKFANFIKDLGIVEKEPILNSQIDKLLKLYE